MTTAKRPSPCAKLSIAWALALLLTGSYAAVATISLRPERSLLTSLDERIPYLPWTVWLYWPVWIVFLHVVIVAIRSWSTLRRAVLSAVLVSVCAYAAFVFFPSSYPRPDIVVDDSLTTRLLLLLRDVDRANNTFPSLHVAISLTLALACWREEPRTRGWLLLLALVPSLATLTVKQHYVVDVVAGAALAVVVHTLAFRSVKQRLP